MGRASKCVFKHLDVTLYPCYPIALKTNRQHAHDAWLYERERGQGRRQKSQQDKVGENTTVLQFAFFKGKLLHISVLRIMEHVMILRFSYK